MRRASLHIARTAGRTPRRRLAAVGRGLVGIGAVLAVAVAPIAVPTPTADAEPTVADRDLATNAAPARHGDAGTFRITLLTGDVVALQVAPDGKQAAWVADPVDERRPPQVYEADGEVHVVPAEAAPYVASDVLDDDLFNVTLLARSGYDDATTDELPLLIEAPDHAPASAMPAAPEGTDEVRALDSVNTVSVAADKSDIRAAWTDIRGPRAAAIDAAGATLAGGRTVWLNGRVEATLDDSVAQIGAPEAWARGYDGTGTTVAVLDTGYDPDHPDLSGRVADAQNFTDPAQPDDAVDGNGHGTHVAATVAGTGAASEGDRRGVAPGADLLVGKVLDDNGEGYEDQIIAGMEWAVDQGADVVNMSLGTPWSSDGTDPMSQAVNDLTRESGTLFVVAAGNSGPGEQTIGAPGAADLALTVGAVTKDDEPAWFSSRGPRVGDGAIKPEITAPGADIVAARAAGTSLGNLVDEYYTSISGTSMATPHVAGAAAILAQQHPRWGAAALKARLVSTGKTLPDQPITFQGGGRVDVATAVRGQVSVDRSVEFLGTVRHAAKPVSRQLTYRNASDHRVLLRLHADVTGTGSDTDQRPELRLSRRFVPVPAHGSAKVTVTLLPRSTQPGGYAGRIVARPVGGSQAKPVHTTMGFTVDGPTRTITVHAVDRAGKPASGPVDLWNAETGELVRNFLTDGTTTFEVKDGLYALVASIERAGEWFASTQHTIAGDPELQVRGDVTLRFDARDGKPVRVTTPRDADVNALDVFWNRTVGDRSVSVMAAQDWFGGQVFAVGSSGARTGSFTLASEWQLAQPLLVARLTGPGGFRLTTPQLASPGAGGWCQCPAQVFEGEGTLRLVDAGTGTPEEFESVDVDGAIALVERRSDPDALRAQAEAAKAAGAALLLGYNNAAGFWGDQVLDGPLPVYTVDRSTGQALLDVLADRPTAKLRLDGILDATYQYDLVFTEDDRIPSGESYRALPGQLATVRSDYRQNSDRMVRSEGWIPYVDDVGVMNIMGALRNGPLVRTEYVTATDGVEWQRFGQPHEFARYYWTSSSPERYRPGRTYHQVWWGPLVHPAVPPTDDGTSSAVLLGNSYQPVARFRDAIRISLPHYSFGGSLTSTIFEQFGDRSEVTLRRDGEVVGTTTWPTVQWTVPADDAAYELTLDTVNGDGNWSDTSVASETTWRFRSERTSEQRTVLPLVQVGYRLDADAHNAMPAGESYPLTLTAGYQPEADGPGRFSAEVEVSFDDGASWQPVPVDRLRGGFRAQVPAADGPGFASVRAVVTDADGNQLSQRIDRAWRIAGP